MSNIYDVLALLVIAGLVYAMANLAVRAGRRAVNMDLLRWASLTTIALVGGSTVREIAPLMLDDGSRVEVVTMSREARAELEARRVEQLVAARAELDGILLMHDGKVPYPTDIDCREQYDALVKRIAELESNG